MPQIVKKRRSGWAVLAVGALVASLFAVGAAPAAALDDDSKVDNPASTSACVGDATTDQMFPDVSEGHAFRDAINCLAYYGVTVGSADGTFKPNDDVANWHMVLFMERAAGIAGADAEDVVGDFATTGSDPVDRADMALLIARLLASATDAESPVNVEINDDGTFKIGDGPNDYFADSRRSQPRISDSAASALYELGVSQGTGDGNFSPSATVSRGAMAAFITRALAHTTARPDGVTIQSDSPGEVLISVRDANFQPVANAQVDVFSAASAKVDEAFNEDGSCNKPRLTGEGGNAALCEIDALDAVTGLSGDYDPGAIAVQEGGTTVWAWTGESGDEVEDGGEGLASIELTETAPVTADSAKVTTDMAMGVTRAAFGSTVTVTIQLVGDEDADASTPEGGASYTVITRRDTDRNIEEDATPDAVAAGDAEAVTTQVLKTDASGKATFTITAADPDATDRNNPDGDTDADPAVPNTIDRVRVTFEVAATTGGNAVDDDISSTTGGSQTITFSDARSFVAGAAIEPAAEYLTAPTSGSASNVVTVRVSDQYGKPVRGHLVRLSSNHSTDQDPDSTFPVARRTDSSGAVRIGYSHSGGGSVESLVANTSVTANDTETLTPITGGTADFYWAAAATGPAVDSGAVNVADLDRNTLIIGGGPNDAPQLVLYDDNDQFVVGDAPGTMETFEQTLGKDADNNDTVIVSSYDPTDSSDVARFVLSVVADS